MARLPDKIIMELSDKAYKELERMKTENTLVQRVEALEKEVKELERKVIKVNTIKQLKEAVRALNGEGGIIELHEGIYDIEGIEDE